ncbi:beta galactosidase jelly roll domain-containing protein [Ancylomarina longa]|uniref:Glycoside hydrolase n=1 Tax=Ancylomarina longa TaxID=2487017 RepID=A0A434AX89_9BACT|nr:beta galactosidase jelly roll domain-containing protein [Ancylomarina longa]RUT79142.1 glycoside hydrolase [Ancylomarina longa]
MKNKNSINSCFRMVLMSFVLFLLIGNIAAENLRSLANLKGNWKFSIGDNPQWRMSNYNDSDWETVFVPNSWEQDGFEDYNGFAWYRKKFQIRIPFESEFVYLYLGQIDDVDEVYVNGKLVGTSGTFPPIVKTAYNIPRMYPIPVALLHKSRSNIIAVRVYDEFFEGGIISGTVGIFIDEDQDKLDIDLTGYWDFEIGRPVDKLNQDCITYRHGKIFVPGFWECRGYNNYDGEAKYTKVFMYPTDLQTTNKALILGVIDDQDEVFLNGEKIKSIRGKWNRRNYNGGDHLRFRVYPISDNLLKGNAQNLIEVIVTDFTGPGGIYRGPIGITSMDIAREMMKKELKDNRSSIEKFIDYWLD